MLLLLLICTFITILKSSQWKVITGLTGIESRTAPGKRPIFIRTMHQDKLALIIAIIKHLMFGHHMDDNDHYSQNDWPYISKSDKLSGPWPTPEGHQEMMGEILKTTWGDTRVHTVTHSMRERSPTARVKGRHDEAHWWINDRRDSGHVILDQLHVTYRQQMMWGMTRL